MSDVVAEYERIEVELERPTLRLLDKAEAPLVISVLSDVFEDNQEHVAAQTVQHRVRANLLTLDANGHNPGGRFTDVDLGASEGLALAGTLCKAWVRNGWLASDRIGGEERYQLTASTQEAFDFVRRSNSESVVSAERIRTIITAANSAVQAMTVDRDVRVATLEAQIADLQKQRDDLVAGGEIIPASPQSVREAFRNIDDLVRGLPAEFKRVAERLRASQSRALEDLRVSDEPQGIVVQRVLREFSQVLTDRYEGRAFLGAIALIDSMSEKREFEDNLRTLASHPAVENVGVARQRVRNALQIIRTGMKMVEAEREQLAQRLNTQVARFDADRDRAIDRRLKLVEQELRTWFASSRPRDKVSWILPCEDVSIDYWRGQYWHPKDTAMPPRVDRGADQEVSAPSAAELRLRGGPSRAQLADAIVDAVTSGEMDDPTIAQVMGALPAELRRPIEIGGMYDLAALGGVIFDKTDDMEAVGTVSHDGTERQFVVPRLRYTEDVADHIYSAFESEIGNVQEES